MRDAHAALEATVRAAYGMGKNEDILTHLLALNHACAEKELAGEKIMHPAYRCHLNSMPPSSRPTASKRRNFKIFTS